MAADDGAPPGPAERHHMPANPHLLARLGDHLVACGLVGREPWEMAARAGDVRAALDALARGRAHWLPAAEPEFVPALTAYQRERVEEWLRDPGGAFPSGRLVWNSYLLLDRLAAGGMGVVFRGWCPARRRFVALKRTLSDTGDLRQRLRREADLLRQLSHPSVAGFYAREALGGDDLLVMEFVPGRTLAAAVEEHAARRDPVPWRAAAGWAVDLLGALDHLNGRNPAGVVLVHRDVKPPNVLLRPDGARRQAVLVDFGLARAAEGGGAPAGEPLTSQYQFLGTPEYTAPEQWHGGRYAVPASDVYGLGGTIYYALTGRPPFGPLPPDAATPVAALVQMMARHRSAPRPRVCDLRADAPPELEHLLVRMLAVEPAARGSTAELRARFEELLADRVPAVIAAPAPAVGTAPPRRGAGTPYEMPVLRADPPAAPAAAPAIYGLASAANEPPAPSGSRTTRRKRALTEAARATGPEVRVDAAPPSPATADVFRAVGEWLGAQLGGPRRAAAGRLRRESFRQCGAWLRAYARPLAHPGRWAVVLAAVGLVGLLAGWDWAFAPLAVIGLVVVFAFLAE